MSRSLPLLAVLAALAALPSAASASPTAVLRADANRDGTVDVAGTTDVADQRTATVDAGVLVLPNVDDDSGRCAAEMTRVIAKPFAIGALAACNDGADTVVNGAADAKDLASVRVLPWPDAPVDVSGTVALTGPGAGHAHLFRRDDDAWAPAGALTAADLRAGVELGLEATDVVRDAATWDGRIEIRLDIRAGGEAASDAVVARVAPVVLVPQTAPAERVFAQAAPTDRQIADKNAAERAQIGRTVTFLKTAKRKDVPNFLRRYIGHADAYAAVARRQAASNKTQNQAYQRFGSRLRTALGKVGLDDRLTTSADVSPFVQDDFESGYAAVPAPGGARTMRVTVLATNQVFLVTSKPSDPRVPRITWPFRTFRGVDAGVVIGGTAKDAWTANGDLEATPPVPGAPRGRALVGSPGKGFAAFLDAQGAQPRLTVDTSWLSVGHVDELFAVIPADTPRGWVLAVADPAGALALLRSIPKGDRGRLRVVGRARRADDEARALPVPTVKRLLAGAVAADSARAAKKIDAQLAIVRRELGLTDADIVRIPVLYGSSGDDDGLVAWTGNTVNGFAPGGRRYLAVAPHGPVRKGTDLFAAAAERGLKAKGIAVTWVDTWPAPHLQSGELHCFTNALRGLGDATWWR